MSDRRLGIPASVQVSIRNTRNEVQQLHQQKPQGAQLRSLIGRYVVLSAVV